jgi:hypothetical protein
MQLNRESPINYIETTGQKRLNDARECAIPYS